MMHDSVKWAVWGSSAADGASSQAAGRNLAAAEPGAAESGRRTGAEAPDGRVLGLSAPVRALGTAGRVGRPGQHRPPGCDERRHERLQQPGLGGVGDPAQLPRGRPERAVRRAGRSRRPHGTRRSGYAVEDPQDHPLVGRGGHGVRVPGRPRVPARGCGAPAPAHRRARIDQCDPGCAEAVLEARAGGRRRRGAGAAGHLRSRAATGRRAQRPALTGERGQPFRDRRETRHLPREHARAEHGAAAPDVERPA